MSRPFRSRAAAIALTAATAVAGCGSDEGITPGPQAGDAGCSALLGRLPALVLDAERRDPQVAGAMAWGGEDIVLRCGVPPTGPTSDPCMDVDGLDWTFAEDDDGYRFTTYGRVPVVEVRVSAAVERTTAPGALVDLAPAVREIPQRAKCE